MKAGDKRIEFDSDGYMVEPELWSRDLAAAIAREEGIADLTAEHWEIITFIREYWQEHEAAPAARLICKHAGLSVREVYKLFTSGPDRGACRIAGLPRPESCV